LLPLRSVPFRSAQDEAVLAYEDCVDTLRHLSLREWYQVRKYITPPAYIATLMNVVCYLHMIKPEWNTTCTAMVKNSEQNALDGDEDAMVHTYDVKLLHLIDNFDIYKIGKFEKACAAINDVCYNPSFQPVNVQYINAGVAAVALVNYMHAANKVVQKAVSMVTVKEHERMTRNNLIYVQRKLQEEQSNHVGFIIIQQNQQAVCDKLQRRKQVINRRVEKLEAIYLEVIEMRVDYVSDDEDRELTYYEAMEANYDEILIECEFRMEVLFDDLTQMDVAEFRMPKRGIDIFEWIEQEVAPARERMMSEGPYAKRDKLRDGVIAKVVAHVEAVIHPADVWESGCVRQLVYARWAEIDEQEYTDEQARKWATRNRENPAGMALWAARNADRYTDHHVDEEYVAQAGAWAEANPEDIALSEWMHFDREALMADTWQEAHPDIPTDEELPNHPGKFGTDTECSDLVLKVRDNEQHKVLTEDLETAEAWARLHPKEVEGAYARKLAKENEAWEAEKEAMAEAGLTWDDATGKFWGVDENGELYEYKTPEQIEAEAAAWGMFKDKETGAKYWFNELTGERKEA
jgi:hypothetical protein